MAVKMKKLAKKEDIHSTLVPPAKGKGETIGLLLVFAVIFALMSLRFWAVSSEQQNLYLRPYQRLDKILTKTQPLIYQSLISSVEEIVYLRDEEGQWPEAELLEMENIPPFDEKFLPKNARGALWEGFDGGAWIDYIGQNQSSGEKITFLLRLIDLHTDYHPNPHPGTNKTPAFFRAFSTNFVPSVLTLIKKYNPPSGSIIGKLNCSLMRVEVFFATFL